jgi:hypothetical protein
VLLRDRRIAAVGGFADLRAAEPHARVVDAGDGLVLPGLVDGHAHLTSLGRALTSVRLEGSRDLADLVDRCRAWADANPAGWIVGRGWDQTKWPGFDALPDRGALDTAFPARPVFLVRTDGHAALVNAAALRAAALRDDTPDPAGGRLLRRADGSLTGVLVDTAMALVSSHLPAGSLDERKRWISAASRHALALGLTGVHDAAVSPDADDAFTALADDHELPIRTYAMADLSDPRGLDLLRAGPRSPRNLYEMRAVKLFADGALGSRGALLFAPYCDEPSHAGLAVQDLEELRALATEAVAAGFQLCTHAIGDRANARVLDLYESLHLKADSRPRIEHAQLLRRADLDRFAPLGVIAAMQPVHATSDRHHAERRLGSDRLAGAYAWRSLLDRGVTVAFGSDFPVESADPQAGFRAAILRQDVDGQPPGGWLPQERVTVEETLRAFTLSNAYASFHEHELGALRPGNLADLTVLAADPFPEPGVVAPAPVLATIVDGVLRHGG